MQNRKNWLNQLKNFFYKHFKEYYLASFCWLIPSSCENHCNLVWNIFYCILSRRGIFFTIQGADNKLGQFLGLDIYETADHRNVLQHFLESCLSLVRRNINKPSLVTKMFRQSTKLVQLC
jgi:hypothetical protein